jgi:molybdopterin converting factor small subunit
VISLYLPSILCERAGGLVSPLVVAGASVREVLLLAVEDHGGLRGWVLDDAGRLRPHVKIFVNDGEATLDTPVSAGDELHVVPAISGGRGS